MTAARVAEIVQRHGEMVTIRRLSPLTTAQVRARLAGYEPSEIAGSIIQGDRRCFIGTQDLIAEGFPIPIQKNDKVVLASGKVLNIEGADHRKWDDDEGLTVLQVRG